jgi:adenosylmethionine-8-amino-7-oxononanoate aminotransferase
MILAFDVETADPGFASRFFASALKHELLLRPLGNTVYFMPPYVISADEIELLARRTTEILRELPAE